MNLEWAVAVPLTVNSARRNFNCNALDGIRMGIATRGREKKGNDAARNEA